MARKRLLLGIATSALILIMLPAEQAPARSKSSSKPGEAMSTLLEDQLGMPREFLTSTGTDENYFEFENQKISTLELTKKMGTSVKLAGHAPYRQLTLRAFRSGEVSTFTFNEDISRKQFSLTAVDVKHSIPMHLDSSLAEFVDGPDVGSNSASTAVTEPDSERPQCATSQVGSISTVVKSGVVAGNCGGKLQKLTKALSDLDNDFSTGSANVGLACLGRFSAIKTSPTKVMQILRGSSAHSLQCSDARRSQTDPETRTITFGKDAIESRSDRAMRVVIMHEALHSADLMPEDTAHLVADCCGGQDKQTCDRLSEMNSFPALMSVPELSEFAAKLELSSLGKSEKSKILLAMHRLLIADIVGVSTPDQMSRETIAYANHFSELCAGSLKLSDCKRWALDLTKRTALIFDAAKSAKGEDHEHINRVTNTADHVGAAPATTDSATAPQAQALPQQQVVRTDGGDRVEDVRRAVASNSRELSAVSDYADKHLVQPILSGSSGTAQAAYVPTAVVPSVPSASRARGASATTSASPYEKPQLNFQNAIPVQIPTADGSGTQGYVSASLPFQTDPKGQISFGKMDVKFGATPEQLSATVARAKATGGSSDVGTVPGRISKKSDAAEGSTSLASNATGSGGLSGSSSGFAGSSGAVAAGANPGPIGGQSTQQYVMEEQRTITRKLARTPYDDRQSLEALVTQVSKYNAQARAANMQTLSFIYCRSVYPQGEQGMRQVSLDAVNQDRVSSCQPLGSGK